MKRERLQRLVKRFPSLRVAVVGDYFLDLYFDLDPQRAEISLETGRTAHQVDSVRSSPGAAGTVVANLSALGVGEIDAVGFTGNDGFGFELRRHLKRLRCSTKRLFRKQDRFTPVYLKPRDQRKPGLEGEKDRFDIKNRIPQGREFDRQILRAIGDLLPKINALIVSDQVAERDCGVISKRVRDGISTMALNHPDVVFWADSRSSIRFFRNVIIKPNQYELLGLTNPDISAGIDLDQLQQAAFTMNQRVAGPVFCTRGPEGILISKPEIILVPGVRVQGPIDTTGAGDSVSAGAVLALAAGASLHEAALVGNLVASVTIRQLNTTGTASPEELYDQLNLWGQQNSG